MQPITFSISSNDYGFELLSDQRIPIEKAIKNGILRPDNLIKDILRSVNATEMAKRQFREIARIAGLVFQGYPGNPKTSRKLQASSSLFFDVFRKYDPKNLLINQAIREVLEQQLESKRLKKALNRIS